MATQEEEVRAKFSGDSSGYEAAANNVNRANERMLQSNGKIRKGLISFGSELTQLRGGMDLVGDSLTTVTKVFKVGLGAMIGAGIGNAIAGQIREAADEIKKLEEGFTKIEAFDERNIGKGAGQLASEIKEANDQMKLYQDSLIKHSYFKKGLTEITGGGTIRDQEYDTTQKIAILQKQIQERVVASVAVEGEKLRISQLQSEGYSRQAEQLKKMQDRERELYTLEHGAGGGAARVKAEQSFALQDQMEERQRAFAPLEAASKQKILDIEIKGRNVRSESAKAALSQARNEQFLAQQQYKDDPKKMADADLKVSAGERAVQLAEKQEKAEKRNMDIAKRVADIRGQSDTAALSSLMLQRNGILDAMEDATDDEKPSLAVKLAENSKAQYEAKQTIKDSTFGRQENAVRSNQGYGPQEEINAQEKLKDIVIQRQVAEMMSGHADENKLSVLAMQFSELEKSVDVRKMEVRLEEEKYKFAQTSLAIQSKNVSQEEQKRAILQAEIESLRAQADIEEGINSDKAKQDRLSAQSKENEQRLNLQSLNYGRTALDIQRRMHGEKNEERRKDQFDNRVKASQGLLPFGLHKDGSGNIISGRDPITGRMVQGRPPETLTERIKPRMPEQRKKADDAFHDLFKSLHGAKKKQDDDEKHRIAAKREAPKEDPIVKAIHDQTDAWLKALMK